MRQSAGMLAKGVGVEKDLNAATKMLRKPVAKNVFKAAEEFAVIVLSNPEATAEDKLYAFKKLQERVEKRNSYMAHYTMAYLYLDDIHFPRDVSKAKVLLAFPSSGDYANSKTLLTELNATGEKPIDIDEVLTASKSPSLEQQIETIKVMGMRPDLNTAVYYVMDQLRLTHGQTGSRIKGNGCQQNTPGCYITEPGKSLDILTAASIRNK